MPKEMVKVHFGRTFLYWTTGCGMWVHRPSLACCLVWKTTCCEDTLVEKDLVYHARTGSNPLCKLATTCSDEYISATGPIGSGKGSTTVIHADGSL